MSPFRNCRRPVLLCLLFLVIGALGSTAATLAGSFSGAGESNGLDLIRHPESYDGSGGLAHLTFCLDPTTAPESAEIPLQRVLERWNQAISSTGNLQSGLVPGNALDFQSVAMRGVGICLGLDSPADGSGFANATNGIDDTFTLDAGPDQVAGSADDLRGDDENLVWFRIADNLPFAEGPTVDSTTFARDTGVLPEGDTFPRVATRQVALASGFVGTEAVMVNTLLLGEGKRRLAWDDVATLRYGQSGLDELSGTADDYQVRLTYVGVTNTCDVRVTFESQSDLVACPGFLGAVGDPDDGHFTANLLGFMAFSDAVNWFFDDQGTIFQDGFETGDGSRWSQTVP